MSPLLAGAEPAFLAFNIMYTTQWTNYYNYSTNIRLKEKVNLNSLDMMKEVCHFFL